MRSALIASVLLATLPAHADDNNKPLHPGDIGRAFVSPFDEVFKRMREQKAAEKPKDPDEHTAADVANAPLPGKESGRVDRGEHDSTMRNIGQGMLFLPKLLLEVTFAPVRASLWTYEHYSLGDRFKRVAFDKTNTYGVTPWLFVDTTYGGVTLGGRFVHRNLFGAREKFALRAGFGGKFSEVVEGDFKTGQRLGPGTSLELHGEYDSRPHDPFYGIGNENDAMQVRFRQQIKRATTTLDLLAPDEKYFHLRMAGAITDLNYGVAEVGTPIDMVYDTGMLTGWTGTRNLYGELELRYDSRRVSATLESKGVLLDAFMGRVHQLEAGNDYLRYGGKAIRFQPLGSGRTLATRLHVEAVNGTPTDVAFSQLPQLGGTSLLRGYPSERFRDRTALAGSAEYLWDVSSFMLASVFVDAGRVYSGVRDIKFEDMRMGYGATLQLVDHRQFLAGISVASSIDGGLFLNLVLDPVYEPEPRVRQK